MSQNHESSPVTLSYRDAPTNEVVASDLAMTALRQSRPWAQLFAIALFLYGVAGIGLGTVWLIVLITSRSRPNFPTGQFIVISTGNLLFAPLAIVGGVLAMRFILAAGRAYNSRSSDDLERALTAQQRIWRWAGMTVIALICFPVLVFFTAAMMNVWP
jgi:hypothetical protein